MFNKDTHALLEKHLPALPYLVSAKSLKRDMDDLVMEVLPPMRLCVVYDRNTSAVGEWFVKALNGKFACEALELGWKVEADEVTVELIRHRSASCGALVAVGSGTINDLCKYASFLERKPYIVVPTAASMNGYVSANASIKQRDYKKTLPAHMPKAVFCDLSTIAAAPSRLSKSGLGDSLARPTAQADWLLSHLVLDTLYDDTPYALLRPLEDELFANARGIALGDSRSIELLMQTLLLSGFGMTIAGGSYPASQGEHIIAHAYHMLASETGNRKSEVGTLHGEEIGVTTFWMAQLQERILGTLVMPQFADKRFDVQTVVRLLGENNAGEAQMAYVTKQALVQKARHEHLDWPSRAARIAGISVSPRTIHHILQAAEAPLMPDDLNWQQTQFDDACRIAPYLRDRFTFLDLT